MGDNARMRIHDSPILDHAANWRARDLQVLWHPCTQMREHRDTLPLIPVASASGTWLVGYDGKRYLDAVSSWWVTPHGHAEPRISAAIARQARTLDQVIKVFYADNGSAAVEADVTLNAIAGATQCV